MAVSKPDTPHSPRPAFVTGMLAVRPLLAVAARCISEITTERIREFLRYREQTSKKGKFAPATLKRALIELNQIFEFTAEKGKLASGAASKA